MTTLESALIVAAICLVGIFIFMLVFYLLILAIDKMFPPDKEKK